MTMQRPTASTPVPPPAVPVVRPSAFRIRHPNLDAHWLKLLLYGEYGAGKTVLAGTADDVPEMQSVLYVDFEAGELALSDRPWLDLVTVTKYADLARIFEYLRIHCRLRDQGTPEALAQLAEQESKLKGEEVNPTKPTLYRTVVIDSLTEAQTALMYQLLGIDPNKIALDAVQDSAEWTEWRQSSDMIQLLARQFRDLPMHVIIVLSEQEVQDGNRVLKRPNLPGKLASRIQGFWDLVGYLQKIQTQDSEGKQLTRRRLWLDKGTNFQAKNRFRHIEVGYVDEPTIPKLLDLARQEWAANDAERNNTTNASASEPATPTQPSTATGTNAAAPTTRPASGPAVRSNGPVRSGTGRPAVRTGVRPLGR